ncbi:gamma-aminobutyric acid receptor subunit beta-like [Amphibalanus amphitrite]|uniref:gamma-aminobutyric acid receptor subunit beta-like n=1 Tax=Amphibalanus amphitrite TaxID=1232801 RepID=UPI001C92756F|nr:gamma-aminobutyric acid receptor subunit beta-like [Amphibalanus amphitrite]
MKCLLLLLLLQRCIHLTICQAEDGYSPRLLTAEENANESTCVEQPTYNVLPADYDKLMPPLLKGVPLNIYFTLWIISITEINELRQDFTVDLYLRMYWVDFRIKYPVFQLLFVQMYLPSILIVLVSFLSFWIPVDNVPGRVSLGVTSLLTLATQFTTIQRSLPPVSYVKAMDIWMFFCIVTVFLAMVEFTLAYNFRFTLAQDGDRKPKPVKEPVTVLGINSIAAGLRQPRVVVLTQPEEGKTPFAVLKLSVYWVAERFAKKKGNFIDNFSKLLFPIAFLVFNLAYWNHYGKGQKEVTFWGG